MTIFETWHPIEGKWVHIIQTAENRARKYFTNGKLEYEELLPKDKELKKRKPY